ncbi:hypothetical protein [Undibacterium sp. GrIS 1.8]|uniref:hypothetical protein n=1 Tax=Undibacterium sp. GrIS 1.8 TaxID=3143934 RepID=UPI003394B372
MATDNSHASGELGIPSIGQRSNALSNASASASSAAAMSRHCQASHDTSRPKEARAACCAAA